MTGHRLLDLISEPREWAQQAACRGLDTNLWFPVRGEWADTARAVCADCPVRAQCAEAGQDEHHGIWGGLSERERRRLRSRRNRIPRELAAHGTTGRARICTNSPTGTMCDQCRQAYRAYKRAHRYTQHGEAS